jgi:ribosomal protein S18 acetylase RimI-like enzyme
MPEFIIREFRHPEDYPAVIDLWSQSGPGVHVGRSDELQEIEKKLQRDPDLFLLAEADGRVIGSVLGGYDGRRGMVYHLAVSGPYRQLGIGQALMNALEERLRAKGCLRCYLLVARGNPAAQFYEQRGWELMDLHIYGKNLA